MMSTPATMPDGSSHGNGEPSRWVRHWAHLVAAGGAVLDVASGAGRHARFFAALGHPVTALDRDAAALDLDVTELRVDGGMTMNELLMQFQADMLGVEVHRPKNIETTATGAAFAAGLDNGFWDDLSVLGSQTGDMKVFKPKREKEEVEALYRDWKRAIKRSLDWEDNEDEDLDF